MRNTVLTATLLIVGSVVNLIGCSKGERLPTTRQATIKGSVTNGDKSVDVDTIVTFTCDEHGVVLGAKVDALGKFQLLPSMKSIGIPAGRYKVTIQDPIPATAGPGAVGSTQYTEMMKKAPVVAAAPTVESKLPKAVTSLSTTKIILEVQEGENSFDIDLTKFAK